MFLARAHIRTHKAVIISVLIAASQGALASTDMTRISCRSTTEQHACNSQEICIDDPRRLRNGFSFLLLLEKKTYSTRGVGGNILVDESTAKTRNLKIYPAIRGGNLIELSLDGGKAKLIGGASNYFFNCRKSAR